MLVPPETISIASEALPNVGDTIEYINNDRNTISEVTHIRYVIKRDEVYVVVTLTEKESKK